MRRFWLLFGLVPVAAAFGQGVISTSGTIVSGSSSFGLPTSPGTVTGSPYSGEESSETVQTLADGTHITRKQPVTRVYRDSLGRTRTERLAFPYIHSPGQNATEPPTIAEIFDPIAQVKYTLDPLAKIAHRQEMKGRPARQAVARPVIAATPAPDALTRPAFTNEKLGSRNIEGVVAEGSRMTTTMPVDSFGNDRPIVSTSEFWLSPELKVTVLSRSDDPRFGESTRKLTNISRSEPSGGLFQVPGDYTIVDEKAEFTIRWGAEQPR